MIRSKTSLRSWGIRLSLLLAAATVIPACGRTLLATAVPYSISNATLASGVVGVAYTETLIAASATGAVTWTIFAGNLPAGLALNSATGQITGIPTSPGGTAVVLVRAVDAAGQVTQHSFLISITGGVAGTLTVTTSATLPGGDLGVPYDFGFSALNGAPPFAWSVTSGTLPPGIVLNAANGGLIGVPTAAGTFLFTIHAGDTGAGNFSVACSLTIASPMQITAATMPPGSVGGAYLQPFPLSGGSAPLLFSISAGVLPAGLSLNTVTGAISGTPTFAGTSGYTIRVTDAAGVSLLAGITHVINPAPIVTPVVLPPSTQGLVYSQTLAATLGTGAYTWTQTGGTLPNGLALSAGGVISGTSTAAGTFNFTVTVTDAANGTGSLALSILINPPVTVSAAALNAWTVNRPGYSQTISASGGTGARVFSVTGSLPTGLALNAATGVISGTPTATGTANFSIVATDTLGATGSNNFSITINLTPSITTATLPDWTAGFAYTPISIAVLNGTAPFGYSVTSGTLPAGLALNSSTGLVNGTPTTAATSNFTITVVDAAGASVPQAYTVVINPALSIPTASPLSQWTQNFPGYSQTLAVNGGTGVARTWSAGAGLPNGLTLSAAGVVSGTPIGAPNLYTFTATVTDSVGASTSKSFDITINPPVTITTASPLAPWTRTLVNYNQTVAATGGTGTKVWSNPGGGLPSGLALNTANGAITGTPTVAATSTFNIAVADGIGASTGNQSFSITINPVPAVTASALLPWTRTLINYNQTVAATGGTGTLTFSNPGLGMPPGLLLNAASGAITGTPTTAGTFTFNVVATDTLFVPSPAQSFTIVINPIPAVTPGALAAWTQSFAGYGQTVAATGGTGSLTFSNPGLGMPPGLLLNAASGAITGTPNTAGTFTFNIVATDTLLVPSPAQSFSITINPPPSFTTTSPLPEWTQNLINYSKTIVVAGGTGTLTVTNPGGGLPGGLTLTAGVISGTPTGTGTSNFNLQLTDGLGATTGPVPFSIKINPPPSITTTSPLTPWTKDLTGYSKTLLATGGTGALTWSVSSGSLPSGLLLNTSTGAITGTPDTAAVTTFDVTAKDSLNVASPAVTFSITINPVVSISTTTLAAWTQNKSGYGQTLVGAGGTGALSWSISGGSFPSTLSLDPSTGTITGTPTDSPATYTFFVQATDTVTATAVPGPKQLSIIINPPVTITSSTLAAWTQFQGGYNQSVVATGGTGTKFYSITTGSFPGSLSFNTSTGAITGTPTDSPGTYNFFVQVTDSVNANAGLPVQHSITINPPINFTGPTSLSAWTANQGGYSASTNVTGGTGTLTWSNPGGLLPGTFSLNTSSGAITGTAPGVPATYNFQIKVTDGVGASNQIGFSILVNPVISITSTSPLPGGTLNSPYSFQFVKANGTDPVTWTFTLISPPIPGLSLNNFNGTVTGTPTATGTLTFNASVQDNALSTANLLSVSLTIVGPLTITTASLPGATATLSYSPPALAATGGTAPYSWSLQSGLTPPGISFDAGGNWTGTAPSVNGVHNFVVKVTDAVGHIATKPLSITVTSGTAGSVAISTASLNAGTQNAAYTAGLAGTGGTPGLYSWSIINATSLPGGLGINSSTGVISGTPTGSSSTFDVQLTDTSTTVVKTLTININPPLGVATLSLPPWTLNAINPYPQSLAASGGTALFTWTASGSLPNGLTLNSGGTISGSPTSTGTFFFTAQVTDAAGATASQPLSISINPKPIVNFQGVPPGTEGFTYPGVTFNVQGGTGTSSFTWNTANLAGSGLLLSTGGSISGTPTVTGSTHTINPLNITVTDAAGVTDTKVFTLTINVAPLITTTTLPSGTQGMSYPSTQLNVTGGSPPFTWTNPAGLPTGLSISASGLITGTPTSGAGNYPFTAQVNDGGGGSATKSLSIDITTGPAVVSSQPLNGQNGVSRGSHLNLTFSVDMDQSTFTSDGGSPTVTISPDPSGGAIATPILFFWTSTKDVVLVFDTQLPAGIHGDDILAEGQLYTITLGTGIKSTVAAGGLNLSAPIVRTFTTQSQSPSPTVTITPDPNDPVSAGQTVFVLNWDQPMKTDSGQFQIKSNFGFDAEGQFNPSPNPPTLSGITSMVWTGSNQILTITLSPGLPANQLFKLQLDSFQSALFVQYSQDHEQLLVTPGPSGTAPTVHIHPPDTLDKEVLVGFPSPMWPRDVQDPLQVIARIQGGANVAVEREVVDFSGMFIRPLGGWPGGKTIEIRFLATIRNAAGDTIGVATPADDLVFTFTTPAADTTAMVLDAGYSTLLDNSVDVDTVSPPQAIFQFTRGAGGPRAFINLATLAPQDVTIVNKNNGIPLKGYDVRGDHGLQINQGFGNFTGMAFNTDYQIIFNTTLLNTQGGTVDTTGGANVLTFTTRASGGGTNAARPVVSQFEDSQFSTDPSGNVSVELKVNAQSPSGSNAVTLDVLDNVDPDFLPSFPSGSGNFHYQTPGSGSESTLSPTNGTVGAHVLRYTVGDGVHNVVFREKHWIFDSTKYPTITTPANGATPTVTWTTVDSALGVDGMAVVILDNSFNPVFIGLISPSATSYTLPADQALPNGTYRAALHLFHQPDGTFRGSSDQADTVDFSGTFSVP